MNGVDTVKPEAVAVVLAAAEKLGYYPNAAARSLAGGRSDSIALVITESDLDPHLSSFFALPLRGAMRAVAASSKQLVLLLASDTPADTARLRRYLTGRHVDGAAVILEAHSSFLAATLADLDLPIVYLGRPSGHPERASYVDVDNYGGAKAATRELLGSGRTAVGTIAGAAVLGVASDRLRGWRDALVEHGLSADAVAYGDFTAEGGAAAMERLLAAGDRLDAVFVASDLMAVGALRVLKAHGLRVPEDVAVIGFDDTSVAANADPPLTSVRQPLVDMGSLVVETLLDLIADPAVGPIHRILPANLVRRHSS